MRSCELAISQRNANHSCKNREILKVVLVRALELAQLDSNRAYINALARFLPSSARLESELAQLNSNSTLQLDELDRAFRAIQLVNIGAITE